MGGVIGAVSNKFVLAAATLLLTARVDHHRVKAVIDPAAPTSEINAGLASSLGTEKKTIAIPHQRRALIGIGAEEFDVPSLTVAAATISGGADLRIGQDILSSQIFDIDFRQHMIRLVLKSEYPGFTHRMTAIPLISKGNGQWGLTARINGSPPLEAVLDLSSPVAIRLAPINTRYMHGKGGDAPVEINLGKASLYPAREAISPAKHDVDPMTIGFGAFLGQHLLLDLPHQRIWLAEQVADRR
jgi:hypothetical protein